MTGESEASVPSFKGINRGSPLENPHREKQALPVTGSHRAVQ